MLHNKTILAVVPARGGSKGIPLKNIISVGGIPLITRVGNVINACKIIDRAVVSTDHIEIANMAKKSGLEVPFFRPEYLSGDLIGDIDVLTHALIEMEKIDNTIYDIVLMLQPTSPFRKSEQIVDSVEMLIKHKADSVWTLSQTDSKGHPYKQFKIEDDNVEYYSKEGAGIIARQQLAPTYHKNGLVYAITRDCILNKRSIKGDKCIPFIIDDYTPNIDTYLDIEFAEFLITKNYFKND